MESIASLAEAAAAGDSTATGELLRLVWPDAFRIAWSVLKEKTAAEDAAQDACARVLTEIATLRRPQSFRLWFYRTVVNESNRRRRSERRLVALSSEHYASDASTDDRLDVRRALDSLETALRVAIVLHYYFGLNSAEIARVVSATPVTVRWRLMVARRRLRAILAVPEAQACQTGTSTGGYGDESQAIG